MPDRRNPHNSYYYKPLDQAAPVYIPPSHSTQRILPVPQQEGQTQFHYGMPGEARPIYIPDSQEAKKMYPKKPMLSDERSKTEIKRLESTNEALTQALSGAYQGGNLPETEYPQLPTNTRLPSHGNFADTPAANKVAAQNVGLMQGAPPPQSQMPMVAPPAAPPVPRPTAPAWNPTAGMAPPDLSELDAAYRRIGQQQGGG